MEKKQRKSKGDLKLGERVRKIREERGLSQAKLASMVSISASCITRLERGENMVSVFTLRDIAQALEVPASWIMEGQAPAGGDRIEDLAAGLRRFPPEKREQLLTGFEEIIKLSGSEKKKKT